MFRNTAVTVIPANFLSDFTGNSINGMFMNCTYLASIPDDIFANCPNLTELVEVFKGCSNMTSIPSNLFSGLSGLQGVRGLFRDCTYLASIPTGLFDNNPSLTNCISLFQGCTRLTGNAPEYWIQFPSAAGYDCFTCDTKLDNIADIPGTWIGACGSSGGGGNGFDYYYYYGSGSDLGVVTLNISNSAWNTDYTHYGAPSAFFGKPIDPGYPPEAKLNWVKVLYIQDNPELKVFNGDGMSPEIITLDAANCSIGTFVYPQLSSCSILNLSGNKLDTPALYDIMTQLAINGISACNINISNNVGTVEMFTAPVIKLLQRDCIITGAIDNIPADYDINTIWVSPGFRIWRTRREQTRKVYLGYI